MRKEEGETGVPMLPLIITTAAFLREPGDRSHRANCSRDIVSITLLACGSDAKFGCKVCCPWTAKPHVAD